jgi:hypothetical protein
MDFHGRMHLKTVFLKEKLFKKLRKIFEIKILYF